MMTATVEMNGAITQYADGKTTKDGANKTKDYRYSTRRDQLITLKRVL